jgi:glycosyltransferase involved in cell wall biosynthesis
VIEPLPSVQLADLMRKHDVYLAASRDDPCSNALLEGLACGLPAAFRRSGGHPELVGEAGIGFEDAEELPGVFAQLALELDTRRNVRVPA